ncbi:MAG: transporter [Flavisolibacter sp.]|jgi:predicted DNA repair protein MutK|nr:transporter [Flavisolibacter sp.]
MASGLFALLDDISALVKASAASLDDVSSQVAKTTGKVSGIVIDDAAVTPKYVVGLNPSRELSIIFQIAKKSLINKILILSPAALLLGYFAPWAITPILMLGGAYLCFEGYEKVHSMFSRHQNVQVKSEEVKIITPEELEKERVTGAVRTDIILSAEIMAIAYSQITDQEIVNQIVVMLAVAIFITVAVYGFVGLIVKADDIGVHLAQDKYHPATQKFGRGIVKFMPHFLRILSYVGTAAMLWVGAEIIAHGIPFTSHFLHDLEHALAHVPVVAWFAKALACAVTGLLIGFVVEKIVMLLKKAFRNKR